MGGRGEGGRRVGREVWVWVWVFFCGFMVGERGEEREEEGRGGGRGRGEEGRGVLVCRGSRGRAVGLCVLLLLFWTRAEKTRCVIQKSLRSIMETCAESPGSKTPGDSGTPGATTSNCWPPVVAPQQACQEPCSKTAPAENRCFLHGLSRTAGT